MELNCDWEYSSDTGEETADDASSDATSSSESMISSFLTGDVTTTHEWNTIIDDIKKQYSVYAKRDHVDENNKSETMGYEDFVDGETEETISSFYIDALDAAEKNLSEVKLLWTHALCQHRFNE